MGKGKQKIIVPDLEFFEEKFDFISNSTLKTNLQISFQYVVFLIKIETDFETTGAVEYSIFKNIIQYTASIVESVFHFGLEFAINEGIVNEEKVMPRMETFTEKKPLYKINSKESIYGVKRVIKYEKFKKNTQFKTVCDAFKKSKLLDSKLIEEVNELREKRNKIHLAGLTKVENYYTKKDINIAFNTAAKVITKIEKLASSNEIS